MGPRLMDQSTECDAGKKSGTFNVELLHIIMLFEADFNNNNKWLSQAVMQLMETLHGLAPEQYGSQNGKNAGIQCLNNG